LLTWLSRAAAAREERDLLTEIAIVGAGEMGRAPLGVLARQLSDARFRVLDIRCAARAG